MIIRSFNETISFCKRLFITMTDDIDIGRLMFISLTLIIAFFMAACDVKKDIKYRYNVGDTVLWKLDNTPVIINDTYNGKYQIIYKNNVGEIQFIYVEEFTLSPNNVADNQ